MKKTIQIFLNIYMYIFIVVACISILLVSVHFLRGFLSKSVQPSYFILYSAIAVNVAFSSLCYSASNVYGRSYFEHKRDDLLSTYVTFFVVAEKFLLSAIYFSGTLLIGKLMDICEKSALISILSKRFAWFHHLDFMVGLYKYFGCLTFVAGLLGSFVGLFFLFKALNKRWSLKK